MKAKDFIRFCRTSSGTIILPKAEKINSIMLVRAFKAFAYAEGIKFRLQDVQVMPTVMAGPDLISKGRRSFYVGKKRVMLDTIEFGSKRSKKRGVVAIVPSNAVGVFRALNDAGIACIYDSTASATAMCVKPKKHGVYTHRSSVKKLEVLIPSVDGVLGMGTVYGDGVYFAAGDGDDSYGEHAFRISKRYIRRLGGKFDGQIAVVPHALIIERQDDNGYIWVKKVLTQAESYELVANHYDEKTIITPEMAEKYIGTQDVAKPKSLRIRLIGLAVAVFCFLVFLKTKNWKWFALGRFLLGVGGKFRIPQRIAVEWNSRDVNKIGENTYSIRPDPKKNLFWIVGTMTVQISEAGVYGEDVYDFHPQAGQSVDNQPRLLRWAWSGGVNDPTRIPQVIKGVDLYKLVPAELKPYFRVEDGYLLFSNNLWNALGGRPFTSVLEVKRSYKVEKINSDSGSWEDIFTDSQPNEKFIFEQQEPEPGLKEKLSKWAIIFAHWIKFLGKKDEVQARLSDPRLFD